MARAEHRSHQAIGARIRELRQERGMTADALARSAGISSSHLSRIERGLTAPSFPVAVAIGRELGVTASQLAAIQREHASIDDQLEQSLVAVGVDPSTAQHIRERISTPARQALLAALDH